MDTRQLFWMHPYTSTSIVRPPLSQRTIIQADIVHMINESELGMQYREIGFGIGDYKKGKAKKLGYFYIYLDMENEIAMN